MRDPTRGGLATVAHEIARAAGLTYVLNEAAIPLRDPVRSVCEILGYDPLLPRLRGPRRGRRGSGPGAGRAGRMAQLPAATGQQLSDASNRPPLRGAADPAGGERLVEELEDDPLPRIC